MSPTWLEIAVAILLVWVAWRIGSLLTPWVISRWRASREEQSVSGRSAERTGKPPSLTNPKE